MNRQPSEFLPPGGRPPETSRLLRSARRIMVIIGVVVALMQVVQHFEYGQPLQFNLYLLLEVIVYVIILPLAGSWLLGLLERSERARLAADESMTRQVALVRRLGGTAELNELAERVVEFPQYVLPVRSSALYLRNPKAGNFDLAAAWSQGQSGEAEQPIPLSTDLCPDCRKSLHTSLHRLELSGEGSAVYSLPLVLDGQALGILHIILPPGIEPEPAQAAELDSLSTDLALALDRAALRSSALNQAQANANERKQIAQDLHDTLAQDIAYLRLKLEQLVVEEDPRRQISLIRRELGLMRNTADEAYLQVREALATLKAGELKEIAELIRERAGAVGKRAGFEVQLCQAGQPKPLEPFVKRQVAYISREALTNIEKHSRAGRVEIELNWQPACLELTFRDNGQGFDAQGAIGSDHYGLAIMRERAESVQGELDVRSAPGQGTAICLRVPLGDPGQAGAARLS